MKHASNLDILLITVMVFSIIIITACNQQQPKNEEAESQTVGGEFDRTVLPILPHPFAGTVDTNATQSRPDFPVEVSAPKGAPNVVLIMTDDVGFGASSTFGGPIQTPTFDALAANGLRYNE